MQCFGASGGALTFEDSIRIHGFSIVPKVLEQGEIEALLENLAAAALRRTRAGVRHILGHPRVAALARDPRLIRMARDVLGERAFPFHGTLFEKSPTANWLVVWHQDTALPLRERRDIPGWGPWSVKEGVIYSHVPASALDEVLAIRIHLDDSSEENGPLRVLPGTHRLGVLSDEEIHASSASVPPVDCLVPRGGVLAMRPLLIHASSKAKPGTTRRVLHIEYAPSSTLAEGIELAVA